MPRKRTPPTVTPDPRPGNEDQKKYEHPSYAVVKMCRSSGQAELFDSAFEHQHFITLSICRAEKHTDHSHDFIHAREEYIEVWMSETQFAKAITSMNMGSGSPCTLVRFNGESIDAPEKEDVINNHVDMVEDKLKGTLDALNEIGKQIVEWRDEKHRPTLKEMDRISQQMHLVASHFELNMGYYARCMEEHMEKVVDSAKAEIEAHLLASAGKLGMTKDDLPQLELDNERISRYNGVPSEGEGRD